MLTYAEYLRNSILTKEIIDEFLDPSQPNWARFDPEVGYVLSNSMPKDGVDGSRTISTIEPNGARTRHNYADKPCRINTYGDSFTQCHQVCDGETWQEYLAAHLGEPIRNFGMGGFGVYQAYRRMLRAEASADSAQNIIFYMWGDDHHRGVMRCRHASVYPWLNINEKKNFLHCNFWANVEMDLDSGKLVERENMCPTPQSLYNMCDPEFMYESLKDDLMVQFYSIDALKLVGKAVDVPSFGLSMDKLRRLAEILGVTFDETCGDCLKATLDTLRDKYAYAATKYVLGKSKEYAQANGKNLLVALFDPTPGGAMRQMLNNRPRPDQEIVDYLNENGFNYFDMNEVHFEDYRMYNLSVDEYRKLYLFGHYKPSGNHFFAFAIKDKIIDMLDPKPITYADTTAKPVF